ncbi:NADPH-dependent FMN reductase [Dethiosulfatibacter aminovorans DSM 17477]|uniref:NADPH-dependent FMN reductase n=1 Tax=Dethiosulfatibacter aminovorans DSM 17477 TaxID=1121476 RepID=A0A1M6EKR3_9FIRM|nr:flavodoxin family protein [Dethiosulfatibacter aminovorans]SHI86102.1 NADPH-dependent FMN reductase [Dethiosulfatibacter aminovorans DSM 17477]
MGDKYIAIMASHRKNKFTEKYLDKYIEELVEDGNEVEKISLRDYDIGICKACGYCGRNYGKCCVEDDMQVLYEKLRKYRNFIFASPVYFNTVSSLAKIFIDRCQMLFECKYNYRKPWSDSEEKGRGIILSVAGACEYENQFKGSEIILDAFFKNLNVEIVEHIKICETDFK